MPGFGISDRQCLLGVILLYLLICLNVLTDYYSSSSASYPLPSLSWATVLFGKTVSVKCLLGCVADSTLGLVRLESTNIHNLIYRGDAGLRFWSLVNLNVLNRYRRVPKVSEKGGTLKRPRVAFL